MRCENLNFNYGKMRFNFYPLIPNSVVPKAASRFLMDSYNFLISCRPQYLHVFFHYEYLQFQIFRLNLNYWNECLWSDYYLIKVAVVSPISIYQFYSFVIQIVLKLFFLVPRRSLVQYLRCIFCLRTYLQKTKNNTSCGKQQIDIYHNLFTSNFQQYNDLSQVLFFDCLMPMKQFSLKLRLSMKAILQVQLRNQLY